MIVKECRFEPPHTHEWPDDWEFGGATGQDPRSDPRWRPTTYVYLDEGLHRVHLTQTPLCDDQAIDEFTRYRGSRASYLQVRRPDSGLELLPFQYNPDTDEVQELTG